MLESYGPVRVESIYMIPDGALVIVSVVFVIKPLHKNVFVPFARLTTPAFVTIDVVINVEFVGGIGTKDVDNVVVLFIVSTDDKIFVPVAGDLYTTFVYVFVLAVSLMPGALRLTIRVFVAAPASGATTENMQQ